MIGLLTALVLAQPPAIAEDPVLARTKGGLVVTRTEYLEYLFAVFGRSRLEELLLDRAMERELRRTDLSGIDPEVRAGLSDPDARTERALREIVARDHGGDPAAYAAALRRQGRSPPEARRALRLQVLREDRITALVQARRTADERALRRLFDRVYGVDGLRVRVRHVFVSFHAERQRLAARGEASPIPAARIEAAARARAEELAAAYRAGESFEDLVARGSDDPLARQLARDPARRARAGEIPGYNFQAFGVAFAEAVRAMRPGEVRGPVRSSHGYHLVQLVSAVRTRFEDVRDELRRRLRREPATLAERRRLRERLVREYGIEEALRD